MLSNIEHLNNLVNAVVWGPPLMVLLIGTGVYLSFRLGWLQLMHFGLIWRSTMGRLFSGRTAADTGEISAFQAVSSAMAATVGVGNIVGVSTALYWGGPGALFWMWITALVGMATKFSEVVLGMKYRQVKADSGEIVGGPMYYIADGLGWKWLAGAYAFLTGAAALGIGNMVQANTVAASLYETFSLPRPVAGGCVVGLVAVVILGGVRRIGQTTAYLVPFMAVLYLAGGVWILLRYAAALPDALVTIISAAFTPAAPVGAWGGATVMLAMRYGLARGIFSNEAGLGSASIVHAQAKNTPVGQGLWGIWEVGVDTLLVASITGLVIMVTGVLGQPDTSPGLLAATAFAQGLPGVGDHVVFLCLTLFAYSTMLTWSFYGGQAWAYLFGPGAVLPYRVLFLAFLYIGATGGLRLVWDISDTLNGMMAIPNLMALLVLAKVVVREKQASLSA